MIFKQWPCGDAEGVILAHTLRVAGNTLKKGRQLSAEDVQLLVDNGIAGIYGARIEDGDIDEDRAALRLATCLAGANLIVGAASAGRCNLYAKDHGIIEIDRQLIDGINLSGGEINVATLEPNSEALPQQAVATVKVIPFAIPEQLLQAVMHRAEQGPKIVLKPFLPHRAALILSHTPGMKETMLDSTAEVTAARFQLLGSELSYTRRCEHNQQALAQCLRDALAQGCNPITLSSANVTADHRDIVPAAIGDCGGQIIQFGMPVEPGNMLLLAKVGKQTIINLPGCSRTGKINGLDWVLQRLLSGQTVERKDILGMGVGGLIKDLQGNREKRQRALERRRNERKHHLTAIVLAAGSSKRMGDNNKLLERIAGNSMVATAVDAALASRADDVLVVTGCDADNLCAELAGKAVNYCHNSSFAQGIASSVAAGIAALPQHCDGAVILLADMPGVSAEHIDSLLAAFDPLQERDIILPVRDGRRGNPVLWPRRYFDALQQLQGDVGGRTLLAQHADNVWEVVIGDTGIFVDIDTPQELEQQRALTSEAADEL